MLPALCIFFSKSAALVEEESAIPLEGELIRAFRSHILAGEWEAVETQLPDLKVVEPISENKSLIHFLVLRQKFLELLEAKNVQKAVFCLREQVIYRIHLWPLSSSAAKKWLLDMIHGRLHLRGVEILCRPFVFFVSE